MYVLKMCACVSISTCGYLSMAAIGASGNTRSSIYTDGEWNRDEIFHIALNDTVQYFSMSFCNGQMR